MKYAEYEFYQKEYGGSLAEEEFDKQIVKASAYVRKITFGRSDLPNHNRFTQEAIQLAACAVCDVRAAEEKRLVKHGGREVASENNDGYSVAYVVEQQGELTETVLHRKCYAAAEDYLLPTGLLCLEVETC